MIRLFSQHQAPKNELNSIDQNQTEIIGEISI